MRASEIVVTTGQTRPKRSTKDNVKSIEKKKNNIDSENISVCLQFFTQNNISAHFIPIFHRETIAIIVAPHWSVYLFFEQAIHIQDFIFCINCFSLLQKI
jgi:hypothetical protein